MSIARRLHTFIAGLSICLCGVATAVPAQGEVKRPPLVMEAVGLDIGAWYSMPKAGKSIQDTRLRKQSQKGWGCKGIDFGKVVYEYLPAVRTGIWYCLDKTSNEPILVDLGFPYRKKDFDIDATITVFNHDFEEMDRGNASSGIGGDLRVISRHFNDENHKIENLENGYKNDLGLKPGRYFINISFSGQMMGAVKVLMSEKRHHTGAEFAHYRGCASAPHDALFSRWLLASGINQKDPDDFSKIVDPTVSKTNDLFVGNAMAKAENPADAFAKQIVGYGRTPELPALESECDNNWPLLYLA